MCWISLQYERTVSAFVTSGGGGATSSSNVVEIVFTSKEAGRYYVALRNQGFYSIPLKMSQKWS